MKKFLLAILLIGYSTIAIARSLQPIVPEGKLTPEQIAMVKERCNTLNKFTISALLRRDYLGILYGTVHSVTIETTPNGACMVDAITNEGEMQLLFTFLVGPDKQEYYSYRVINRN